MGNVDDALSITVAVLIVLTGRLRIKHSDGLLTPLFARSWIRPRTSVREESGSSQQARSPPLSCHTVPILLLSSIIHSYTHSRDRQSLHVLANELVPGDIVTFSTGDRIPADIRISTAIDLEIDESSLTGETDARRKYVETCQFEHRSNGDARFPPNGITPTNVPVALAERSCIAYMGTLARNGESFVFQSLFRILFANIHTSPGRGTGIVIATGTDTEFGVIFSMMQDVCRFHHPISTSNLTLFNACKVEEKRTPLQLSMDELAKKLSLISFGIIGVICLIGVLQRRSWLEMFTIGGSSLANTIWA